MARPLTSPTYSPLDCQFANYLRTAWRSVWASRSAP